MAFYPYDDLAIGCKSSGFHYDEINILEARETRSFMRCYKLKRKTLPCYSNVGQNRWHMTQNLVAEIATSWNQRWLMWSRMPVNENIMMGTAYFGNEIPKHGLGRGLEY